MGQHIEGEELENRLCAVLDYICSRPKLEPAWRSGMQKTSGKGIWLALKRSQADDPRYLVRWPDRDSDDEKIQFAEAVQLALRLWKLKFSTSLMEDVERGTPEIQMANGAVIYEHDSALLARFGGDTPEARDLAELTGIFDYPYKHRTNAATGEQERIPLVLYKPTAAALRQHVARSLLPGFNPPEHRSSVTSHTGTVMIVGGDKKPPPYARAPESPLKRDLRQRLADLRQRQADGKDRLPHDANGRPTVPQMVGTDRADDPPERVGNPGRPIGDGPRAEFTKEGGFRVA
jgi:hypothetical protein